MTERDLQIVAIGLLLALVAFLAVKECSHAT